MRRSILLALSGLAIAAAIAVGPMGAAAAAPYVYGCTPVTYIVNSSVTDEVMLNIYNGSATTASVTRKILAYNGSILNPSQGNLSVSLSLPPTHTDSVSWYADENAVQAAATIRLVSNVPLAVTLSDMILTNDWNTFGCASLQP